MANLGIGGTFNVSTVEDGTGVPYIRVLGTGYAIERDGSGQQTQEDLQRIRLAVYNGETVVELKFSDIQADATTNNRRGIALFAVRKSDFTIVEKQYYDTYYDKDNGTTRRAALLAAINSHKSDCYIALSSHDAYWWSQDLSDILVSLGGRAVDYSLYSRVPFAFVGFDGVGEGKARQKETDDSATAQPATVEVYIANEEFVGDKGDDATVVTLVPNPSTINFAVDANNTYTPAHVVFYCGWTITKGEQCQTYDGTQSSQYSSLPYAMYKRSKSSAWGSWSKVTSTSWVYIPYTTNSVAYEIALSTATDASNVSDSNIITRVVVPIVKGGEKGEQGDAGTDAIKILSGVTDIHVKANSQGISTEQKSVSLAFQLEAPDGTTANATSVTVVSKPSGVQTQQGSPIHAHGVQVTIPKFIAQSTYEGNLKFSVTGTIGGETYTQECIIPIVADLQGKGAAEWANTRVNNCGKWISGTRYYNNSSRQDFVYVEIPKTETEEAKVEGYVLVKPDNGSYVSNTPPNEDVLEVSGNTVTGHWELVSYNDIGFFGAIIATLVQAKEGQFDSLVAKDCLFDNITLTGVLNNLAQTLTYDTISQFGYVVGDVFHLNPLKIGQYVFFDWNGAYDELGVTEIYLPCVYSSGTYKPTFGGYKAPAENFTLFEMRQMVGKKIMLMPLENISGSPKIKSVYKMLYLHIPYFEAFSNAGNENFDYDLNNFDIDVADKRASIIKERLQVCGGGEYQIPTTQASCLLLECKAGLYKRFDCVYWEVSRQGFALIED